MALSTIGTPVANRPAVRESVRPADRRGNGDSPARRAADSFTGSDLIEFLDELAADGKMNAATAAVHQTAVRRVLAAVPGWEEAAVLSLDHQALYEALLERHLGSLKRATLDTYWNTYVRAVEMLAQWGGAPREARPERLVARRRNNARRRPQQGDERPAIEHVVPLANGRLAELRLPLDLTAAEARRLGALIAVLAYDES